MKWFSTLLLVALPCAAIVQEPTPRPAAVVGVTAPSVRLNDQAGKIAPLGGASERWTIMAFYPKAATPG